MLAADGTGCSGREQPLCPGSSSIFLAMCEASLARAGYGPGALAPYSQTEGQDSLFHRVGLHARRQLEGLAGDHNPQNSDTEELGQKQEGCECPGVPPQGAGLSSHPSRERAGWKVWEEPQN